MEPIEIIELSNGNTLEIHQDDMLESPREWDNLGTLLCFHSSYELGDDDAPKLKTRDFNGWPGMEAHLKAELNAVVVLPVYLLDHSGLRVNTVGFGCPWDSSQIGFIYATAADMKEAGVNATRAKKILNGEIDTMDDYLSGSVYGYRLMAPVKTCKTCEHESRETLDAVYGYYGAAHIQEVIKEFVKKADAEANDKLKVK